LSLFAIFLEGVIKVRALDFIKREHADLGVGAGHQLFLVGRIELASGFDCDDLLETALHVKVLDLAHVHLVQQRQIRAADKCIEVALVTFSEEDT
jgi:hypothetical protein